MSAAWQVLCHLAGYLLVGALVVGGTRVMLTVVVVIVVVVYDCVIDIKRGKS